MPKVQDDPYMTF